MCRCIYLYLNFLHVTPYSFVLSLRVISLVVINKKRKYEKITVGILNQLQVMITQDYNLGKVKENVPKLKLPRSLSTCF